MAVYSMHASFVKTKMVGGLVLSLLMKSAKKEALQSGSQNQRPGNVKRVIYGLNPLTELPSSIVTATQKWLQSDREKT
jgi:hypothetical protein